MRAKKVRAPISGKRELCQYVTNNRHGNIELIMECRHCEIGGLDNLKCYRGVLGAIQLEGIPSAIILRSHIEKRYGARSTRAMSQIAELLNQVDDLHSQLNIDGRRNDKCAGCLKPLINELEGMSKNILARKIHGTVQQARILKNHTYRNGARCDDCAGMIQIQVTSISKIANNLEKEILAGTFNIVEVDE